MGTNPERCDALLNVPRCKVSNCYPAQSARGEPPVTLRDGESWRKNDSPRRSGDRMIKGAGNAQDRLTHTAERSCDEG